MNYGERLASWYLRLNGFLPMPDFVLHRLQVNQVHRNEWDAHDRRHADVDLLAVRFPYVFEEIGGQSDDWDPALGSLLQTSRPVGLIVEVKTSPTAAPQTRQQRLRRSIQRIGLVDGDTAVTAAGRLHRASPGTDPLPVFETETAVVGTMLVCPAPIVDEFTGRYTHIVALEDCDAFIRRRLAKYRDQKSASRLMFPDELIQYLAWRAGMDG